MALGHFTLTNTWMWTLRVGALLDPKRSGQLQGKNNGVTALLRHEAQFCNTEMILLVVGNEGIMNLQLLTTLTIPKAELRDPGSPSKGPLIMAVAGR